MNERLMKDFEKETGLKAKAIVTDGVHVVGIEVFSKEYVEWLETKIWEELY